MKAKGVGGVAALAYAITALTVGGACSGAEPPTHEAVQQPEMPSFTQVKGLGEGVLTIEYQREGDSVTLVIWDADRPRDRFMFRVVEDDRLQPATKRNRMSFWMLDDEVAEVERFVRGGFHDEPKTLTTQAAQDFRGYYHDIAVIEDHGRFVLALWSNEGMDVYANVDSDAAAVFVFAQGVFDGISAQYGPSKKLTCCITCGGTGSCCCDGGDECVKTEQVAKCSKNGKLIEKCSCNGSDCGCKMMMWVPDDTTEDESSDIPGMGETEGW